MLRQQLHNLQESHRYTPYQNICLSYSRV